LEVFVKRNKMKYKASTKSFLLGIAGFIISIPTIAAKGFFLFGYPLFVLSILMFVLGIWQLIIDNKR